MKKIKVLLLLGIVLLAGCNSSQSTTKPQITKADVLKNVIDNQNQINNFETHAKLDFQVETEKSENVQVEMDIKFIEEPLQTYINLKGQAGLNNQKYAFEYYVKDDISYAKMNFGEFSDKWYKSKFDQKQINDFLTISKNSKSIEFLTKYIDQFEFKINDQDYEFVLKGTKVGVNDVIDLISLVGPKFVHLDSALEDLNLENLEFKYVFDKITYFPKNSIMSMEMVNKTDATDKAKFTLESFYKNVNQLTTIEIPENIIKEAITY